MTFIELVKVTNQLPNSALSETGNLMTHEVTKTKIGYLCVLWCGTIANPQDHIYSYGTGSTEQAAKETLIKKILKEGR
jgi:hypothetical protein